MNRLSGSRIGIAVIRPVLAVIRLRHNMQQLEPVARDGRWAVRGVVNPTMEEMTQKLEDRTTRGAVLRTYEGINAAGFGREARVTGLSEIGRQNSPSVEGPGWNLITRRLFRAGAASYYYVRGHLINGTFGGPGNDWRNLVPLTQTANNRSIASMLSTFENPVRTEVNAGGTADLRVTAVYSSRGLAALAARVRDNPASLPTPRTVAERQALADLIAAEEHIPVAVETSAVIRRGGTERRISERTENVIDTEIARYYHRDYPPAAGAAARREVNLNSRDLAELRTLVGVDEALALRIVTARPTGGFRDRDHFIARLGADGASVWHRISSTAGVRLVF